MSLGIPFGKYRLTRRLARGGMAEVFLATQEGPEGFERTVAVKRILPHLADNPQFTQMFMDEARLAAQISHPNIAHIYEFGETDGTYFIAMEYIKGVDLSVVVMGGPGKPLPMEHGARIIADVCAALHHAHNLESPDGSALGLVHRDISPQNVLVSFDGAVKILDFGIAKVVHHVERTQPGIVRGKFSYMSPEQVEGKHLDRRSDLFSAGIVLYELCTGSSLFPRTDAVRAMYSIRNVEIPRPMRDGEPLPAKLCDILDRALAQRREDRYSNAAEMQLDLEEYLRSASRMSNSVVLGEYFKEHYQRQQKQGQQLNGGGHGPVGVPDGTARVEDPRMLLGLGRGDSTDIQILGSEDLEPLTPEIESTTPVEVSGIIHNTPGSVRMEPTATLESDQIISVVSDDTEEALSDSDATVPQRLPPAEEAAQGELHSARTSLQKAPKKPQRKSSRALLVLLAVGVILCGVFVGYLVSVPLDKPQDMAATRGPAVRPDASSAPPARIVLAPATTSKLVITSSPSGASIKVDGTTLTGLTPLDKELRPGTHTILASLPGHEDRGHVLQLEPGKVLRVSLVLRRLGQGEVVSLKRAEPAPEVAPLPPPRRLPRKKRRPPRKRPKPKVVEPAPPQPAQPVPVKRSPPPRTRYGLLNISTIPWTRVYLKNRELGITPLAKIRLPVGTHRLHFVNPSGISVDRSVTVRPGVVTKLRLRF